MFSAGAICWPPGCAARISTPAPERKRRWRALWSRSAGAGRAQGSCFAPTLVFACLTLMAWCEAHKVDYVFGLARNARLEARIAGALSEAEGLSQAKAGLPARVFCDFDWSTKDSWSRRRRVGGQGRVDARRGQSAFSRDLVESRRLAGQAALRKTLLRARPRWRTASRSARATCSPTAPRQP